MQITLPSWEPLELDLSSWQEGFGQMRCDLAAFGRSLSDALVPAAEVTTRLLRGLDERYQWYSLTHDRRLVLEKRDAAALDRLADRFRSVRLSPAAWRALAARAVEIGFEQAKTEALMAGVFGALLEREAEEQRIRFGRHYLRDEQRRPARVAPGSLGLPDYLWWLGKEIANAAEAFLIDELDEPPASESHSDCFGRDYTQHVRCGGCPRFHECGQAWAEYERAPHPRAHTPRHLGDDGSPSDEALLLSCAAQRDADPAELVLSAEEEADSHRLLAAQRATVEAAASPRQRDLLRAMRLVPSVIEAARLCGMDPATARVQLHRLKKNLLGMM